MGKAVFLLQGLAEESPEQPQYRLELAEAHLWQGHVRAKKEVRRLPEAEQAYTRALALADKLVAQSSASQVDRRLAADCRIALGFLLRERGQVQESEAIFRQALQLWERLAADFPAEHWYGHELAYTLDSLGWLMQDTAHRPEKAEPFFRRAMSDHEKLAAEDPSRAQEHRERLARSGRYLGDVLVQQGKHAAAAEIANQMARASPDAGESFREAGVLLDRSRRWRRKT